MKPWFLLLFPIAQYYLYLPHYPGSNYSLSFVIILIILNCRKIDDEIKNICDLRVDTIIQSASKCLITINPSLKVPTKLPSGISHRIEVAAQIASICKVTISVLIKSFPIVYSVSQFYICKFVLKFHRIWAIKMMLVIKHFYITMKLN